MNDDWEDKGMVESNKGSTPVLKGAIVIAVSIAIVLMFIGGIFMFLQSPLNQQAEDSDDLETASWLDFAGRIIFFLGASVLSAMMIIGAVLMRQLDPAVRFGMLLLAGLMLIGTGLAV